MHSDDGDPQAPSFDIPDLELLPEPKPRVSAAPVHGGDDDPFDALSDGVSLGSGSSLDSFDIPSSHASSPAAALYSGDGLDDFDADAPVASLDLDSYRPAAGPAASLPPALDAAPQVSAEEVAAFARYGPVPTSLLSTPAYALTVFRRRRELQQELLRLDRATAEAEAARDEVLATIAQSVRGALEAEGRHQGELAAVGQAEATLTEQQRSFGTAQVKVAQTAAEYQHAQERLSQQAERQRAEETTLRDAEEDAERQFKRAEAKQKRLLIEARNARQAVEHAAGGKGAPLPPDHAAQLAALDARAAAEAPAIAQFRQLFDQARGARERATRAARETEQERARLEAQQRAAQGQQQAALATDHRMVTDARGALRSALAELARRAIADHHAGLPPDRLLELRAAEAQVQLALRNQEICLAALDAHDQSAVSRGLTLAGAALAGLVVLLLVLIAL